jgi:hypothetical protein
LGANQGRAKGESARSQGDSFQSITSGHHSFDRSLVWVSLRFNQAVRLGGMAKRRIEIQYFGIVRWPSPEFIGTPFAIAIRLITIFTQKKSDDEHSLRCFLTDYF